MTGDFSLIAKSIDFLQALENAKIAFMDVSNHDLTSLDSDLAMIY